MQQEVRKETAGIEMPEFNVSKSEYLDENTYEACFISPLLAEKRYVVTYSDLKNPYLKYLLDADVENEVRVILTDTDKRSAVYKQAEKAGVIRTFDRLKGKSFESFVLYHLKGCQITPSVYAHLIERMQYGVRPEADLYTIECWLNALASAPQPISVDVINHIIPEHVDADAFRLFDALIKKDSVRYFMNLNRLLEEDKNAGIGILSLLLRNYRISYKASLAGNAESEIGVPAWQIKRVPDALGAIKLLQEAVNDLKRGRSALPVLITVSYRLMAM